MREAKEIKDVQDGRSRQNAAPAAKDEARPTGGVQAAANSIDWRVHGVWGVAIAVGAALYLMRVAHVESVPTLRNEQLIREKRLDSVLKRTDAAQASPDWLYAVNLISRDACAEAIETARQEAAEAALAR